MERVIKAIKTTKGLIPDYFENNLKMRLEGVGSFYPQFATPEELEKVLKEADWEETYHPDVMPGCTAFKCDIPGIMGLVGIDTLDPATSLVVVDPKGTGKVSLGVSMTKENLPKTNESWIILGEEQGKEVVFTFHPGEPVRPSMVEMGNLKDGDKVTIADAKAMGFDLVKII